MANEAAPESLVTHQCSFDSLGSKRDHEGLMRAPEDSPMPAKDMANSFDAVSGTPAGVHRRVE